ncbi:hypothetical protein DMH04_27350 [Kibdelosporangium aridum]|uniref:Uncharacterized protein n=1 Tax=Kibdelosporangium aridum TaxID=2030 RepID=A0A428Z4N8_KIBAR|nr:hypothetical protein [Kibdelosporangium aridum]RSM81597.1 hypothetical protein DMH04_27350 [Kibdelosporangium aridum]
MADGWVTGDLRAEYQALLRRKGLSPRRQLSAAERQAWLTRLPAREREFFADLPLTDDSSGLFDHLTDELRATISAAGLALPTAVLVAEYPHEEFNARARAVPGGTLILLNTGFGLMVYEITKVLGMSVRTFSRSADGSIVIPEETQAQRARGQAAEQALANAVLAYLYRGGVRNAPTVPIDAESAGLAWRLTHATEKFVLAHEFAHLVEGHLAGAADDHTWLNRTSEQEFQADETGALLVLHGADAADVVMLMVAVSGPMLFFVIDHLITRVRNEIDDLPFGVRDADHPTSDERSAALREMFIRMYGTHVMQLADGLVRWLASREELIVAEAVRQRLG